MSEMPEVKSLRWLCNQFPLIAPPQDDGDRICSAIHVYCENGARKIEELQDEVNRLKVFEEYCITRFGEMENRDYNKGVKE